VAELITTFARLALLGLAKSMKALNFQVIYGDTDSLFVKDMSPNRTGDLNKIVKMAQEKYQVEFSIDKVCDIFSIPSKTDVDVPSKKQYWGLLNNGKVFSTTLIAMKSNYPKYINEAAYKVVNEDTLGEFNLNRNLKDSETKDRDTRVAKAVLKIFNIFDEAVDKSDIKFIYQMLARTEDNERPLSTYLGNDWHKQVFEEILDDCNGDRVLAEKKTQAHSVIPYFKIKPIGNGINKKTWTIHPGRYTIDKLDHKMALWQRVETILKGYSFSKEECRRLKSMVMDQHSTQQSEL
jgi:DNA polymerase elongation subunit (family B)